MTHLAKPAALDNNFDFFVPKIQTFLLQKRETSVGLGHRTEAVNPAGD
jgi:hypothetical protein